ncbi:MAG: DNA double-strand break repair nuclease NurA, partial [Candidatus Korarchaeota archaeon]|nr:DNA double-strand break repair nuclease NurA [Candidatus Korarchaeota archaeon]
RRTCRMVDVDILEPPLIAERIRLYREALEAKAAFHMLDGSEVLLMDGSIISTLIKPAPFEQASLPEAVDLARLLWGDGVFDELLDLFRESLPHSSGALAAKAMVGERPPRSKGYINAVVLLEYLEKLLSYKAVLEKAASAPRRPLIGFVSKTSRSHLYFEEQARKQGRHPPPDIYVFEALDPPPGYAEPREAPMPKLLPEELGIAGFFRSVRVVVSYVRLVRGGPVMRVEIPLGSRSDVGRLASMLAPVSPDGYPHPLHEAHMSCRVSRRDMVNVARMLGIDVELTGREVLGEWL